MPLAEAAGALGRLDATLVALDAAAAEGAVTRLALAEAEAMLWAGGIVLPREEIGRDAFGCARGQRSRGDAAGAVGAAAAGRAGGG
ncbi:hypothetical protein [Paracoccus tibetensis]|uniref:Uncharacterized protein n=1 Tax=Paracoccus tibetensis TaxID=336292 RepID=A0A1G5K8N4_9RHOB|nr:hypothetical protein [Paracoccus tibetensis]SCY97003.1 hypothetical protein SAMN05660710_03790 [Paracoccus tibetensis]